MTDDEDALFSLPPEGFIAARDDLARRLKADGDAARAKEVKALRRPTVAAWAINMAVRRAPEQVDALLELHRELLRAQRQMLSGVKRIDVAALGRRRREAIDVMLDQAAAALAEHDRDLDPHREDVRATFEALVADPDAAAEVRAGRLQRALPAPAGFGTLAGLSLVPPVDDDPAAAPSAGSGRDDEDGGAADAAGPADGQDRDARDDEDERARAAEREAATARIAEAEGLRARMAEAAEEALRKARDLERRAAEQAREADTAEEQSARRRREADAAASRAQQAEVTAARTRKDADAAAGRAGRARQHADDVIEQLREADALLESLAEAQP